MTVLVQRTGANVQSHYQIWG